MMNIKVFVAIPLICVLPEKGTTEDEMAGWHHRLYGHEFE